MGNVRIQPDGIRVSEPGARFRGGWTAGARHEPAKPVGPCPVNPRIDLVTLLCVEPLQGEPYLGVRVKPAQASGKRFHKWQHQFRRICTRVAAGKKHAGKFRTVFVQLLVFRQMGFTLFRVRKVELGRRPNPVVQPIQMTNFADAPVHGPPIQRHVRAFPVILKGNVFNAVTAEQGQFPYVLLILGVIPGVVGISLEPVAELMAAQGIRGTGDLLVNFGKIDCPGFPSHDAQETAHGI
ncbi:MAG: hypothetical protein BWY09_02779 [Candidatus Hydrogenedentes bacterium ADurb.Bin179]|nr:MAG: hypothetical protein BWY09_02779 [Candidatus Hydrogenedentes bacterium ADurb.Bin179]